MPYNQIRITSLLSRFIMNPLLHYDPNNPYPESDGQPIADNTEQHDCLVKISNSIELAQRAEQEHQRAEKLAERLCALGIDPSDV